MWEQYRAAHLSVRPWNPQQDILEVNTRILKDAKHSLHGCLPGTWRTSFEKGNNSQKADSTRVYVYCHIHQRYEQMNLQENQLPQLARGFSPSLACPLPTLEPDLHKQELQLRARSLPIAHQERNSECTGITNGQAKYDAHRVIA